ncbi:MAG: sulfatase-like hydrolase/transferase [Acidobacteria bacterium]|nr:sulfatase-like hydrolase/transferase [Acidobacteriota bacterium]
MNLLVAILLLLLPAPVGAADYKTKNLVLVTADGLRWQEVFRGIDPLLMELDEAGMKDAEELRTSLWAETPEQRRRLLMPFLWTDLVSRGVILGNGARGAAVTLRNRHRFSYPGYSEILTGRPQDDVIDSNTLHPNPLPTVLEILRREWELPGAQVALFGSWNVFQGIGAHDSEAVFINAGYQRLGIAGATERLRELSRLQFEILTPWPSVRHDYVTFEMALEYLKTTKPRVLYIALGETDDWAHNRRYDRTLATAGYFDDCLRNLWAAIQSDSAYRDSTTLIVATDHGRGSTPRDWNSHGAKVEGAERVWIAAIGPDTPAGGEAHDTAGVTQSDIGPTMLELAGVDYRKLTGVEGKPIDLIVGR